MVVLLPFDGVLPEVDPSAFVAPNATLIGRVTLHADSVVMFGAVLRADRDAIVLDPMLATGNSSAAAIEVVKEAGARTVTLVCLVSVQQGIDRVHRDHPDVHIVCAAIDRELDERRRHAGTLDDRSAIDRARRRRPVAAR